MTSPLEQAARSKAELRRQAMARRRTAHADRAAAAAAVLAETLPPAIDSRGKTIAAYWPIGDEIDCRPAMERLAAAGLEVVLPVVAGQGQVLLFRVWKPEDQLEDGPFGTSHPATRAAVRIPDVVLLPLVAFDQAGHRLGYGAGYYDRTLAALRGGGDDVLAVGLAYDEQEIDQVPADIHDQVMDAVVTDRRVLWFNRTGQ